MLRKEQHGFRSGHSCNTALRSCNLGERNQNGELSNLELVNEEKDIGARFDDKLQFSRHISNLVSKGNQRIGLVRRNFYIIDNEMFLLIHISLI